MLMICIVARPVYLSSEQVVQVIYFLEPGNGFFRCVAMGIKVVGDSVNLPVLVAGHPGVALGFLRVDSYQVQPETVATEDEH